MTSFWEYALMQWRKPTVEALALDIQRHHGYVVYFLLGAWLAEHQHRFCPRLCYQITQAVEPVEARLVALRQQRRHLVGEQKKEVLAQELVIEKALYQQLETLVQPINIAENQQWNVWWEHFFPQLGNEVFKAWRVCVA